MENTTRTVEAVNVNIDNQVGKILNAVRELTHQKLDGKVVRLVAALPFLAGCADAEIDSLHNVLIYAAGNSEAIHGLTNHAPEHDENYFERIRPMLQYSVGDEDVLTHGSALLATVLVYGYHRDIAKDAESGEYNPFVAGSWDFETVIGELDGLIARHKSPLVERRMSNGEAIKLGWLA